MTLAAMSGKLAAHIVNGMHQQVPVLSRLLQLTVLCLHDLLLQHHHHLRAHAAISIQTPCKLTLMLQHPLTRRPPIMGQVLQQDTPAQVPVTLLHLECVSVHMKTTERCREEFCYAGKRWPCKGLQRASSMLCWLMRSRAMSRVFLRMSMLGVASARSMSISIPCITCRCRSFSSCTGAKTIPPLTQPPLTAEPWHPIYSGNAPQQRCSRPRAACKSFLTGTKCHVDTAPACRQSQCQGKRKAFKALCGRGRTMPVPAGGPAQSA